MSAYSACAKHIKGSGSPVLAALLAVLAALAVLAWQAPALAGDSKDGPQAEEQAKNSQDPSRNDQKVAGRVPAAKDAKGAQAAEAGPDAKGKAAGEGPVKDDPARSDPAKEESGKDGAGQEGSGGKDGGAPGDGDAGAARDARDGKGAKDAKDGKEGKDAQKDKPSGKDGKDRKDAKDGDGQTAGSGYAKKHLWPPFGALITSPYGAIRGTYRVFGAAGVRRHGGVDIRAHLGWPVTALRDGTVLHAGPSGAAGIAVDLKMKDGRRALYYHLSKVLVKPGETVTRGQHLGFVGCTGRTTGAHLHFGMKNEAGATIDPTPHIQGLWELFDPPASDLHGTIQPQSCDGHRHPGGYPWAGRNFGYGGYRGRAWRGRHYGPLLNGRYFDLGNSIFGRHAPPEIRGNRRLRGTQQYLRMRRALQDTSRYRIQDAIPSWESQHRKP